MARKQATPDVDEPGVVEMVDQGVTKFAASNIDAEFPDDVEIEGSEFEESEAPSAATPEPTSRRSRPPPQSHRRKPSTWTTSRTFALGNRRWISSWRKPTKNANASKWSASNGRPNRPKRKWPPWTATREVEDHDERQVVIDQMAALKAMQLHDRVATLADARQPARGR